MEVEDLKILILETDLALLARLEKSVRELGISSCFSAGPDISVSELEALAPDLALLGPSVDSSMALKCISRLKIIDPAMPVLISCADGAVSARYPCAPFEGIRPCEQDSSKESLSRAIQWAMERRMEPEPGPEFPILIGQSGQMQEIRRKVRGLAGRDVTLLITGETGTGKELVARSIHYFSPRSKGPLVKINCGALPDELLESEVFGFQRGAFTGAHRDKPGRLEMAHGGTLFIDEVGALTLPLQAKFLQILEDKAFSRLGATTDEPVDTRVVAATNSDLRSMVRKGSFRKDLFYRLNVVHLAMPPLRDRRDDIPVLARYFLDKYSFELKKPLLPLPDGIADIFIRYQWPGNVRELENIIRRATVFGDWGFVQQELGAEKLRSEASGSRGVDSDSAAAAREEDEIARLISSPEFSLRKACRRYACEAERAAIVSTLRETGWNRKRAARILRVSYKTLLNRIREFGLEPENP